MAFKVHLKRNRDEWRVSVKWGASAKRPVLRFYFPPKHRDLFGDWVEVALGNGDDFGRVRITAGNGKGFKILKSKTSTTTLIGLGGIMATDTPVVELMPVRSELAAADAGGAVIFLDLPKNVSDFLDIVEVDEVDEERERE